MGMSESLRPRAAQQEILSQCVYCGCDLDYTTITRDHVIPTSRGGANWGQNVAPACRPCNVLKGCLTAREFLSLRDDPQELEAYKRTVERELSDWGMSRHKELHRPLPPIPPKPPPIKTYAQRQAEEREKTQRARAMAKAGECIAELGFTCHCQVCDPKAHTGLNRFHKAQEERGIA